MKVSLSLTFHGIHLFGNHCPCPCFSKNYIICEFLSLISFHLYVSLSLLLSIDKNNQNVSYGTTSRRDSLNSDMDKESQQNKSSDKSNFLTSVIIDVKSPKLHHFCTVLFIQTISDAKHMLKSQFNEKPLNIDITGNSRSILIFDILYM